MDSRSKGEQIMDERHEGGTVPARGLVEERMSRCLFGDWQRRALLKLTLPACDGTSSFWIPGEDRDHKNPDSVSQVGV